jgi:hypothetical protein
MIEQSAAPELKGSAEHQAFALQYHERALNELSGAEIELQRIRDTVRSVALELPRSSKRSSNNS